MPNDTASSNQQDHYQLAQVNIARMLYPLDDPRMHGFTSQLDAINALADNTKGFIWRLQDDAGDATNYRILDNDMIIVNLSVWESIDSLFQYTYHSNHSKVFRQRRDWFEKMKEHHYVLWWINTDHTPNIEEAVNKLNILREHGPSPEAFTFKTRFKTSSLQTEPKH